MARTNGPRKTNGQKLDELIEKARKRKMTPEDRLEQTINDVIGNTFEEFPKPLTRKEALETLGVPDPREIRRRLRRQLKSK